MTRHQPERSCVACRRKRPQAEFVRVTRAAADWQLPQAQAARTGRGAYLCKDTPECWQEKRLRRAFGAQAAEIAAQREQFVAPRDTDHREKPMQAQ